MPHLGFWLFKDSTSLGKCCIWIIRTIPELQVKKCVVGILEFDVWILWTYESRQWSISCPLWTGFRILSGDELGHLLLPGNRISTWGSSDGSQLSELVLCQSFQANLWNHIGNHQRLHDFYIYIFVYIYIWYIYIHMRLQQDPTASDKFQHTGMSDWFQCSILVLCASPRSCLILAFRCLVILVTNELKRDCEQNLGSADSAISGICASNGVAVFWKCCRRGSVWHQDSVGTMENHPPTAHATGGKDFPGMVSTVGLTKLSPASLRTPR